LKQTRATVVPAENLNPDARFLSKFKLYGVARKNRREFGLERRVQTDTEEYIKRHISHLPRGAKQSRTLGLFIWLATTGRAKPRK
jgi:hypothetical protein